MSCDLQPGLRPVIRYRPGVPRPERRKPAPRSPSRSRDNDPRVVVDMQADWPVYPPVTSPEIAVIETFLGERIDALLARSRRD